MTNRYRVSLCLLLSLLSLPVLKGDPLVAVPAGDFSCAVTVTYHEPLAKGENPDSAKPLKPSLPVIKAIAITRTGNLRQDLATMSDGSTSEVWIMEDTGLMLAEVEVGGSKFIYELPKNHSGRNAFSPTILTWEGGGMSWINAQSHVPGDATHAGKPAVLYQASAVISEPVNGPRAALYQAWVDPKTLAPLAVDDGDALYELTFSAPPATSLVLPDRFKKDLQHYYNANATIRHL